ncbi:hypothetical protein DUZ99_10895 [Xylanibacillus composti]|nr:hypothetical protein [Xylanibacillus composti]
MPSANSSYCQACSGLSPPSYRPCRAHNEKRLSECLSSPGRFVCLRIGKSHANSREPVHDEQGADQAKQRKGNVVIRVFGDSFHSDGRRFADAGYEQLDRVGLPACRNRSVICLDYSGSWCLESVQHNLLGTFRIEDRCEETYDKQRQAKRNDSVQISSQTRRPAIRTLVYRHAPRLVLIDAIHNG